MKQKKLLVLAAGILQAPIIKHAREMGYFVIAADGNPNAVGLQFANKQICANITDEDEMLVIAKREDIDGVIHPCSEVSMNVMGRINDELGLAGITAISVMTRQARSSRQFLTGTRKTRGILLKGLITFQAD